MLVQRRDHTLRLIRQHDHALLAGAFAFAWRGEGEPLPAETALAAALHDAVWREEDELPRLDGSSGAPYDFTTIPRSLKQAFIASGVARMAALLPEVAALVAGHHEALSSGGTVDPSSPLAWLRFFDNLSLLVCLTPPESDAGSRPRWLQPSLLAPPLGSPLAPEWVGADALALGPFPFAAPIRARLPYRDIPDRRYGSDEELMRAWRSAADGNWLVTIQPRA